MNPTKYIYLSIYLYIETPPPIFRFVIDLFFRITCVQLYVSMLYKSLLKSCNHVSVITIMLNLKVQESNNNIISSKCFTKLRAFIFIIEIPSQKSIFIEFKSMYLQSILGCVFGQTQVVRS